MKIARAIEKERDQTRFVFLVKRLYDGRWSGKTKPWPPMARANYGQSKWLTTPSVIEVDMNAGGFHMQCRLL